MISEQQTNMIRLSAKKDWYLDVNYWLMPSREMEIGKLHTQQSLQKNGSFNSVRSFQYRREFNINDTYNFGNQKLKKAREVKSANDAICSRT